MVWENPHTLWLLFLLPLTAAFTWWWKRRSRQVRQAYFSDEVFEQLVTPRWVAMDRIRTVSLYSGFVLLILALAGPKIGTEVREVKRQGIDILVALDLSMSMKVEDVRPNRLEKAKFELTRMVDRLKGDRVGLIVFTGEALLQVPLTNDYSAFKLFLNIVNTDLMPSSSTDFSSAMRTALDAYSSTEGSAVTDAAKVLLVVSDGEDHGPEFAESLAQLKAKNVIVFTVGIGTPAGGAIPLYDESGRLIEYKRDAEGMVVTSGLQRERLQNIAQSGNGAYYEILRPADGLDPFLGRIESLDKQEFATQEFADYENRYQWPLALAWVMFTAYLLLPSFKPKT
jgi:Ca-activated chloride channel family protein